MKEKTKGENECCVVSRVVWSCHASGSVGSSLSDLIPSSMTTFSFLHNRINITVAPTRRPSINII